LAQLPGVYHLVGLLLYGSGLRLLECLTLRIKDVDLGRSEIRVRRGKGQKDRVTMVPEAAREPLRDHLERVRARHEADLAAGAGAVILPEALARKYSGASRSWVWQWVFPTTRQCVDRETGEVRRHHLHPSAVQRALTVAVRRSRIAKRVSVTPCAFLRDPSIRGGIRHPNGAGAAGAPGWEHDDNLHPRVAAGGPRSPQPGGPLAGQGLMALQGFPFTAPGRRLDDVGGAIELQVRWLRLSSKAQGWHVRIDGGLGRRGAGCCSVDGWSRLPRHPALGLPEPVGPPSRLPAEGPAGAAGQTPDYCSGHSRACRPGLPRTLPAPAGRFGSSPRGTNLTMA
jgi:hypothetical protein